MKCNSDFSSFNSSRFIKTEEERRKVVGVGSLGATVLYFSAVMLS